MTDFEKALAQAKKFAEKNENQITETEFETLTDSFKIEPDEMINLRAELENSGVMISDPDLGVDDDVVDSDGEDANVVDDTDLTSVFIPPVAHLKLSGWISHDAGCMSYATGCPSLKPIYVAIYAIDAPASFPLSSFFSAFTIFVSLSVIKTPPECLIRNFCF